MRVGPRVWKTALAVSAAILICRLLELELPVFAGVAAIICMQPTIAGSLRKGMERMQATIIGVIFSLLVLMALDAFPLLEVVRPAVIGLTVLAVMAVTLWLGWLDSLVLAAATVVVILDLPAEGSIYSYAISRAGITFIGIIVAGVVNVAFLAPSYSATLQDDLGKLIHSTSEAYGRAVEGFCTRSTEVAHDARKMLADSEGLLRTTTTRMQWVEEEARLRSRVPYSHAEQASSRPLEIIKLIRQSTATVTQVTQETLCRMPRYTEHDARVYDILREIAEPSIKMLDQVDQRLLGRAIEPSAPVWTDGLHKRFIEGVRKHRTEVYPLVEASVVEFEVRRVTALASELDAVLIGRISAGE